MHAFTDCVYLPCAPYAVAQWLLLPRPCGRDLQFSIFDIYFLSCLVPACLKLMIYLAEKYAFLPDVLLVPAGIHAASYKQLLPILLHLRSSLQLYYIVLTLSC